MGDPAGEAPDSLELLRVDELLAELPLLGDVAVVGDEDRPAAALVEPADPLDPAPAAVAVPEAELVRRKLSSVEHRDEVRVHLAGVVRVDERRVLPADELRGLPAQHPLDRGALVDARPVREDHGDHVARVLDQRPEVLLALAEGVVRGPALGHVLAQRDDPGRGAELVALEDAAPADLAQPTVPGADRALEVGVDRAPLHAVEEVRLHLGVVVEELEPVVAEHLVARPAGQLEQKRVDERDGAGDVDPRGDQRDPLQRLEETPLERLAAGGHDEAGGIGRSRHRSGRRHPAAEM